MPAKLITAAPELAPVFLDDDHHRWADLSVGQVRMYGQDMDARLGGAILDGRIEQTIEGASTLTLTASDPERRLLRENLFANQKFDVSLDGVWYRLVGYGKQGDQAELTFENRVIAWLRGYDEPRAQPRGQGTRARFIFGLINEVTEGTVLVYCPEINTVQPIAGEAPTGTGGPGPLRARQADAVADATRAPGLASPTRVTVKGETADREQRANIATILRVGVALKVPRRLLILAIMVATAESTIRNLSNAHSDGDSRGVFQQTPSNDWGSDAEIRNVEFAATSFFEGRGGNPGAMDIFRANPNMDLVAIAHEVQRSAHPGAPAEWYDESKRTVDAFAGGTIDEGSLTGLPEPAAASGEFAFQRGQNGQREDTWACATRLMEEVGWRIFTVGNVVFILSEEQLFRSRPRMNIREGEGGVDVVDFDVVMGRKPAKDVRRNAWVAEMTLTAGASRWQCPPGTVGLVEELGPADGRWLVVSRSRALSSPRAEIHLKKPVRELPEPAAEVQQVIDRSPAAETPGAVPSDGTFGYPLPAPAGVNAPFNEQRQGYRHSGVDLAASGGTPLLAVADGRVTRNGGFGGYGHCVDIDHGGGIVSRYAHMPHGTAIVRVGQTVRKGQRIGTVDTTGNSTGDHLHFEIIKGGQAVCPIPYIPGLPKSACV